MCGLIPKVSSVLSIRIPDEEEEEENFQFGICSAYCKKNYRKIMDNFYLSVKKNQNESDFSFNCRRHRAKHLFVSVMHRKYYGWMWDYEEFEDQIEIWNIKNRDYYI